MLLSSSTFEDGATIPSKFTCDGGPSADGVNPELIIHNVPPEAKSLALIVDDPDAPGGTFTHWTVWNIRPDTERIKEESIPPGAIEGMTDFGRIGYGGPCPPSGTHRYVFTLYALTDTLNLPEGAPRAELERSIEELVCARASLTGTYMRGV